MEWSDTPIRLTYIVGTGRSGSTVIDSFLGNHPSIQSVGELARLLNDAWTNDYYCSCGKRSSSCTFWSAVHQGWCELNGGVTVEQYAGLQSRFEQLRRWPFLSRERWKDSEDFQSYAKQTRLLLRAIQNTSGCKMIVDSSKGVERAYALAQIPGIDLRVIHLVRDPRGVVWSHKKAFKKDLRGGLPSDIEPEPTWRAALYWCRLNLQAEWLRKYLGKDRSVLVRYEDFMQHTRPVMEQVGRLMDVDFEPLLQVTEQDGTFNFSHTIAGNRVRMKGQLRLKFDEEWREKLETRDRRITEALSGWLMARYGYRI
ncbi:MAG: sulfotransferase family protein [Chloroflexota bacterium]